MTNYFKCFITPIPGVSQPDNDPSGVGIDHPHEWDLSALLIEILPSTHSIRSSWELRRAMPLLTPLLLLLPFLFLISPALTTFSSTTVSWYTTPANNFTTTLPLGNGRLGISVWGTATENITLNEDSIWSGPFQQRTNPASYGALWPVRFLLANGSISEAGDLTLDDMVGIPDEPQSYSALGALKVGLGHAEDGIGGYMRWLDLETGVSGVEYTYRGVGYKREYVASYPDGVVAMRFSSNSSRGLDVVASLERDLWVVENTASVVEDGGRLLLRANASAGADPIQFTAGVRVVSDGHLATNGSAVLVRGASTVDLFFDTETSYRYATQQQWEAELNTKLDAAVTAGYPTIKSNAIADYSSLFNRVSLDLGSSSAGTLPTDVRLVNYRTSPNDPELATLMFNFGRYSLITSSRASSSSSALPANLQGLWNEDYDPAWGGRFTIDINLEMNYWPAEVTNLADDTFPPFIDLLDRVQPHGVSVAEEMYHCTNGGYVLHHNTDLWGDAAPVDNGSTWTMWPMGGAWLSANLMEHYRFTQDRTVLRTRIWPLLQSAARFYTCYLFPFNGHYSTGPSLSPEAAFIVPADMTTAGTEAGIDIAPTMDSSLLHELFQSVLTTCAILSLNTSTDCTTAAHYLAHLPPPQIGPAGRILEWRLNYEEADPGHRHMSPIFGLFPGSQFAPLVNSTLATAAKAFLDWRIAHGSGSTGWSRTWTMNLYARLFDGDQVWNHTQIYLQRFPSPNLWNTDSGPATVFQIDGNFGFVSGIAEMLLQSYSVVHLLPAVPGAVPRGAVRGLVARGNFVVDVQWEGGVLGQASITARSGGWLEVRVQDGREFVVDGERYTGGFETEVGGVYTVALVDS
ncbi:alpha-L-fucosidase 2 precursor [Aspergillus ellipticus CBS 707.79]|uniref:Alpha-L-fucosidase 2 n=1 Tax=Aspergillus ellipticus CBS 707.79 TaxID=1448320 RepID=A0A319D497_9EURO|nr:alpha-L-fucosidase 2 precursor [Aspergillus ellipticus CBS 707.79]